MPSLLSVRLHNESHGQFDAELFEIANVYLPKDGQDLPDEPTRLAILTGRDFRALKGVVEGLLTRLHVGTTLVARPAEIALFAPGRAAELLLGDIHLGYLGEIDRVRLQEFELREACGAAELEFGVLLREARLVARHHPLPPFPAVVRDLSLEWHKTCLGRTYRKPWCDRPARASNRSSIWIPSEVETCRRASRASISAWSSGIRSGR